MYDDYTDKNNNTNLDNDGVNNREIDQNTSSNLYSYKRSDDENNINHNFTDDINGRGHSTYDDTSSTGYRNQDQNVEYKTQSDYYWTGNNYRPAGKKKSHKKVYMASIAAILVVAVGVGTVLYQRNSGNTVLPSRTESQTNSNTESNIEQVTVNTSANASTSDSKVTITDVSSVVKEAMPSVVSITSTTIVDSGNYGPFGSWGSNGEAEQTGAGSGIIIQKSDSELLILTNNHVVSGATKLSIQFCDDKSVEASVKGTDSDSDLAVVAIPLEKINSETLSAIKIATLGSSDDLTVGEGVIAIGNALGYGQSVTTGIVSALDREVESSDGTSKKMIQTDAAINGGNSGGALLNSAGQLVGINAAKYSSSASSTQASIEGMGFAIPISSSTDIINNLMNQQTKTKVDEANRGYLGITGWDVSATEAKQYSTVEGVLVSTVVENGAADKAGIAASDVITGINGTKTLTMDTLKEQLSYYAVGDTVTVTVNYRDGREYKVKDVQVTLQKSSTVTQ